MPGRLLPDMDHKGAQGAEHLANGVGHGSESGPASHTSHKATTAGLTNGDHGMTRADNLPAMNGAASQEPDLRLPAELLQMIENSYWSMSTLIERVTQECYNSLVDLVTQLEDEEAPPAVNGAAGSAAVQAATQAAAASVRRKQLLLNFTNIQRTKFIKLMVVLQWGRRADDIQKLVKVRAFLNERLGDFVESADSIGLLKHQLLSYKQQNPDIPTALEALSSASASWIPDLGYIPPKPLSNAEMQQTLNNLDALLSIRINLHEELPRQLKDWDVANGRATFRIPKMFEFDVTIVDEDPAEQFWFIDVRFLFTPAPEIPDGPARVQLGDRADQVLKSAGLQGCYDLLHDFVLTYQISVLRKQAYDMSRDAWHGNIRIENVHRSLIVQYWPELQSRSWIEIGISSGQTKGRKASWKGASTPKLDVRWFRNGVETPLSDVEFDWVDLSVECVLKQVISRHIMSLLSSIEKGLALHVTSGDQDLQTRKLISSAAEPADCSLALQVRGQQHACNLLVEPIGGRLLFSPSSKLSVRAEAELNSAKHPESTGAATVARYAARLLQEHVKTQAAHCGWHSVNNLKVPNGSQKFAATYLTISFFRGKSWGQIPWAIAYTVNLGGGSWWAVELADSALADSIASVHALHLSGNASQQCPSPHLLRSVERRAVVTVSLQTVSRQLAALKTGYTLQQEQVSSSNKAAPAQPRLALLVQAQSLLRSADPKAENFAKGLLRLYVQTYNKSSNNVDYMVRGSLPSHSAELLAASLSAMQDKDVIFSKGGPFMLKISSPFGTSCIDSLVSRLFALSRIKCAVTALKKCNVPLKSVTLSKITFGYVKAQPSSAGTLYAAEIIFLPNPQDTPPFTITFSPNSNPHRRVQQQLTHMLTLSMDRNPGSAFDMWLRMLLMTLPVLRALGLVEDRELAVDSTKDPQASTGVTVHCRKLDWYRLHYHRKHLILDIRLKRARDKVVWMIEALKPPRQTPQAPQMSTSLAEALKHAWTERGAGWRGLVSCVEASLAGVHHAILHFDQVVRTEASMKVEGDDPVVATAKQTQQGKASKAAQRQATHDVVDLT